MSENTYTTADYYETALLFTCGYKLVNTDRNGERINFIFSNKESCEEVIKKYFANELKVKARDFVEGLKTVKSYIFRR